MDAHLKERWVKALRSGDYNQGVGNLRFKRMNGRCEFCCLGVLADVAGADWNSGLLGSCEIESDIEAYLSPAAEELVGLTYETQRTLATMNDDNMKFAEIADYIEKHL